MKNDINDIKDILQEEKTQTKSDKELYNNLVRYLYNIFNNEVKKDLLERGFIYFNYNSTRQKVCNELAESQAEYNYYFMNYTKALKQVKSFFQEDIKRINAEKEDLQPIKQKRKHTIFGVNPIVAILLLPIIIFFEVLDSTK